MKILTCFYLISILLCYTRAQEWCPPGAHWIYQLCAYPANYEYRDLLYEKDTIIDDIPCKKISATYTSRSTNTTTLVSTYHSGTLPPFFTYEQNDSVYIFYDNQFRLVYDFNLQVGETFIYHNWQGFSGDYDMIVESTDLMILNEDTLKSYVAKVSDDSTNFYEPLIVVENIGAINNYFFPYIYSYLFEESVGLACYEDDNIGLYNSYDEPTCDYIFVPVGLDDNMTTTMGLSPNPVVDVLNIFNVKNAGLQTIKIYNVYGHLIHKIDHLSGNQNAQMDVSDLPEGMYIIELNYGNMQSICNRFIKQ